ncbi:hypothetical protein [Pedobacter africanus]|uniref:YD repeat-containing protein n=1 Tax=Pedobacter africanus TaxID=151894 RepID=A0A1W2BQ76_9SPHI|nr:hypothetical protein [Pedobacter africanus]SMC74976.1 hypothetical protein SAMN04488524_2543 [Pedobacter africanus]
MRKLYLILLGFTLPYLLYAQAQEVRIPVVKPVSPSAAGIFKTLERPIGSYTGTVPVNFPLFKITSGSLETSIALDYNNTGGIRVEEIATNVGLGFNLSAGGRITRIQKGGISDDEPGIGYLANSVKPSQIQMNNSSHLIGIQRKSIDLDPDIFMYNFNGESGKFFFNESGQPIMMQESKVKVQYFTDAGGIKSWILHDRDGNKYHFTLKEYTTSSYQNYGGGNTPLSSSYASSWLLTEIKDINNQNSITFSYQQSTSGFFAHSGGNRKVQAINYSECDPDYFDERVSVYTETSEYILSKIMGSSGHVSFSSSNNRLDLNGGSKLTDLTLYDHNNIRLKKCHFNYDYFVSGSDAFGTPSNNPNYYRLKLKSFSEFGENNTDSLNYSFTYNEQEHLPQRLSYAVDYWGFYNGQVYNPSPLPNISSTYYGQTVHLTSFSNKEVVQGYPEAGILTKITYPTGGSREFLYEGNTALLTLDSQIAPSPYSIVGQEISRTDFSNVSFPGPCLKQTFNINSTNGFSVFSYVLFQGNLCGDYSIRIYAISSMDDEWGGALLYTYENEQSWSQTLNNGMYRLEVYKSGPGCNFSNLQLNWDESIFVHENVTTPYGSFTKTNRPVGGVRVKEIRDYDPVSAKTFSTKYLYKLYSTDSTLTSGLLNTPVRVMNEFNTVCSACRYMMLYTSSCYPLASEGGSFVVYPEVRTIEEGNGWTDRFYTYSPDDLGSEFEYPIPPLSTEPAKLRGKLLSEKTYTNGGNLLNENSFFYEPIFLPGPGYSASGAVAKLFYVRLIDSQVPCMEYGNSPTAGPSSGKIRYHDLSGIIYGLAGKSEKKYYSNGSYVETKTSYAYDTDGIGHPIIKQMLTTGDGKTRETNYRYSFNNLSDFKFGLTSEEQTFKSVLLDSNYLQPLEITYAVTYPNASPIFQGGSKYSFNRFNGVELNIGNVKEYTSNTDYKETVFSAYQNGRLLEKYTAGGPKEVYLWGYNDQYPVAKVTGRDYNTLTGWFSSSVLNNPASDGQLQTHLAALRNNLSSELGQVETYSYKPVVGMTSQTDAKGTTTYYEYDNFQRLKYIKDQQGNIIKSYDYHYKP